MRDPKGVPGLAGGDVRGGGSRSRGLDVRFASGAEASVGRRLKEMYDGLVSEPVPDRFTELLSQLESAEAPAHRPMDAEGGLPERDSGAEPEAKP